MIQVENPRLTILDQNQYLLSWSIRGESTGAKLSIERSESPTAGFKELGTVDDTELSYLDSEPPTHRKYIPYYYRLKNPDNTYSEVVNLPHQPDKYVLQHINMMNRHLQRDVGILSYHFHYMRSGLFCDCWDSELRKSVVNDCEICDGTGRKTGFADPVSLYIAYPPDSPNYMNVGYTKYQILMPQAWTSNYPLIFADDVIIRWPDKEVFKVEGEVRRTGKKLYPARQMFVLRGIEHGSVEYQLIGKIST